MKNCPHCDGKGKKVSLVSVWSFGKGAHRIAVITDCGYCAGQGDNHGD